MAAYQIVVWQSGKKSDKRIPSAQATFDFQSIRVGADNLEILQNGSGAGAAFDFGNRNLMSTAAPTASNHLVNKEYADNLVVTGGRVKEAVLIAQQLSNGQGLRAAMVFYATAVAADGDTVVLTNGTATETWTFAAADGANTPAVGASAAQSMQNLATRINLDSTTWNAVWIPDQLDSINAAGVVVVYEVVTSAGASTSRMYGTWATPASAQTVPYNGTLEYTTAVAPVQLPSADPAAGRFGIRKEDTALVNGEIHFVIAGDSLYSWDADGSAWFTLAAGTINDATSGAGGGLKGKVTADSNKGLLITSGVLEVVLSGNGLTFTAGAIDLELDGSTLSKSATGLKVADAGVTETQLAASVAGAGLTGGAGTALTVNPGDAVKIASDAVAVDFAKTVTNDNAGAITVRQVVYIKANGNVDLAQANVTDLQNYELAIVEDASIAAAASGKVTVRRGAVIGGFTGLTPGERVYVSRDTAGAVTQDLSAWVAGEHVYRVGRALSATELIYDPEYEIEY